MMHKLIDQVGDWSPQLFRELKGRLKVVNVAIAVILSLLCQLVLFLGVMQDFPGDRYSLNGKYCLLAPGYQKQQLLYRQSSDLYRQLDSYRNTTPVNKIRISELQSQIDQVQKQISDLSSFLSNNYCPTDQLNMQLWWRDHWQSLFLTLTIVFIYTLLVAGTYLLINNLATEERRGTLNFIRLSPQSETSVLTGKILGVPILIYLLVFTAMPLHFYAGRGANIATSHILSFWVILTACCIFFYSAALLFGLYCRLFSGFQPWLGSGAVLLFLIIMQQITLSGSRPYLDHAAAWFRLLSPFDMTAYLFPNIASYRYKWDLLENVQFLYLPAGSNLVSLVGLHILNYGFWIYWIWQGLKRCFRNPNATLFSKSQSYFLVACSQIILWGFTLQYTQNYFPPCTPNNSCSQSIYDLNYQVVQNFVLIAFFNLILLFSLLAILTPHRQTLQDWARYRYQNISSHQRTSRNSLIADLIWGEKSPALVAMVINLVIATTPLIIWIILAPALNVNHVYQLNWLINKVGRFNALLGVGLFIILMMIYATLAQRMLLMKTNKRSWWAIGTVSAAIFLPPLILGLLGIESSKHPILWLVSTFPWGSLEYASTTTIFMALLGELTVLALLNMRLTKQIRLAGESTTKTLLAG